MVAAFVAGKAARDAILLSSFAVETLPLFVGASALISIPIIMIAGRLMTRFGPARLVPALCAISAVGALAEWSFLPQYPRPVTVAIYFHLSTSGAVLVSGFWSIVNERFDVRSAKRHIGRIGMGATIGGILGGLIAERTAAYVSHDKILLVLAAMQVTSALALHALGRSARLQAPAAADHGGVWSALRGVATSKLLRAVGAIVVLGAVAAGVLDYVFKADLVRYASRADLLRSLSLFYMTTAVITAVIQIAICGPLVARLGVPRSVAMLPITVTAVGAIAIAAPGALSVVVARGAEAVTRNSVYRAGYELLYAPMSDDDKRPTKVLLDVGGERIGDLLGAQLVAVIVFSMAAPRVGLLIATVVIGALATMFALRLPRSYSKALEQSLMAHSTEPADGAEAPAPESWITISALPALGQSGDALLLARRARARSARAADGDPIATTIGELRSNDPVRIKGALTQPITPALAAHVVDLIALDDVAREAVIALRAIAPECTGMLVDALLDRRRDVTIRRRLPAVLLAGESSLAAWGLWRGLGDPSFDVRYRCGAALAQLAAGGHLEPMSSHDVFETVKREFLVEPSAWKTIQLTNDLVDAVDGHRDDASPRSWPGLEHVFRVLGLALPAEPLRVALQAVQTEDPALRGIALEYLESILPPDIRAQLWPLLAGEGEAAAAVEAAALAAAATHPARPQDEILAELHQRHGAVIRAAEPHKARAI